MTERDPIIGRSSRETSMVAAFEGDLPVGTKGPSAIAPIQRSVDHLPAVLAFVTDHSLGGRSSPGSSASSSFVYGKAQSTDHDLSFIETSSTIW